MRRSAPHSPAKERLLEAAQNLMIGKGFHATTVDEVCEAAGVSKGSFFHYFATKEALGKALVERYCASTRKLLEDAPFRREADPLRRLLARLDFHIEASKNPLVPRGCLLGAFAQDLSETHPELRALCARGFDEFAAEIRRDLDAAGAAYGFADDLDTRGFADLFTSVVQGSLLVSRAKQDMRVFRESLEHLKRYVRIVFEQTRRRPAAPGVAGPTPEA